MTAYLTIIAGLLALLAGALVYIAHILDILDRLRGK